MKKILALAAIAVAAIGCTKTEVDVKEEAAPLTFSPIQAGVKTKAQTFPETKSFKSFAFKHAGTWASSYSTAEPFINGDEVSYYDAAEAPFKEKSWHTTNPYYWPASGYVTFFAAAPVELNVSCAKNTGIMLSSYDVNSSANKNTDFMVADVANDQTKTNGTVQTVFRHKLTRIDFKISTAADYANGHTEGSYAAADITFELESVKFTGVKHIGTYMQNPTGENDGWICNDEVEDVALYDGSFAFGNDVQTLTTSQEIFLPQVFDTAETGMVVVKYKKNTYSSATDYSTEEVTVTKSLRELQTSYDFAWGKNKHITYNLVIDLDQQLIYWNPVIEEWAPESHDITL